MMKPDNSRTTMLIFEFLGNDREISQNNYRDVGFKLTTLRAASRQHFKLNFDTFFFGSMHALMGLMR